MLLISQEWPTFKGQSTPGHRVLRDKLVRLLRLSVPLSQRGCWSPGCPASGAVGMGDQRPALRGKRDSDGSGAAERGVDRDGRARSGRLDIAESRVRLVRLLSYC